MRLTVVVLALWMLTSCQGMTLVKTPIATYNTDLIIKLLACDYQIKCREGVCAVKWHCPRGFGH